MVVQAITLREAYMIENLRHHGVSNKELVGIDVQAIKRWNELDERFDFNELKSLAKEHEDKFASIIRDGYQVKFLTLNGLINLVQLKFDKEQGTDFIVHDDGISNLKLDKSRYKEIKQFLSQNRQVIEADDQLAIRSINS